MKKVTVIILIITIALTATACVFLMKKANPSAEKLNDDISFNDTHKKYENEISLKDYGIEVELLDYAHKDTNAKRIELSVCIDSNEDVYENLLYKINDSLKDLDVKFNFIKYDTLKDKMGLTDNDGNIIDITLFEDDSYYFMEEQDCFLKLNKNDDDYIECCEKAYKDAMFVLPQSYDVKVLYYNEDYLKKKQLSKVDDILNCEMEDGIKNLGITLDNETILSLIASVDYDEYKKIVDNKDLNKSEMGQAIISYFDNDKIVNDKEEELIRKFNKGEIAAIIANSNKDYNFRGKDNIKSIVIPKFTYNNIQYNMLSTVKIHWLGVNALTSYPDEAKLIANNINSRSGQFFLYTGNQKI